MSAPFRVHPGGFQILQAQSIPCACAWMRGAAAVCTTWANVASTAPTQRTRSGGCTCRRWPSSVGTTFFYYPLIIYWRRFLRWVAALFGGNVVLKRRSLVCSVVLIARIVCGVTIFMYARWSSKARAGLGGAGRGWEGLGGAGRAGEECVVSPSSPHTSC